MPFEKIAFKKQPKILSYRRAMEKEEKNVLPSVFFFQTFFQTAAGGATFSSLQKLSTRLEKSDRATIDLRSRHNSANGQPAWCRARPTSADDGLEDTRWVHVPMGESLPTAPCAFLPNFFFSAIRDGSEFSVICFVHTSGRSFFHHAPAQRPPHTTDRSLNTVTLA